MGKTVRQVEEDVPPREFTWWRVRERLRGMDPKELRALQAIRAKDAEAADDET